MGSRLTKASVAAVVLLVSANAAEAHIVGARLGDFYAGAAHPLTDLRDLCLWLAISLLAGSLGAPKARLLVVVFPIGLLAGFGLHVATNWALGGALPAAAALATLGLLLALELRIQPALLSAMAFGLGVMSGASNAEGMSLEANAILFAAGGAAAGYVTITLVMAVTVAFRNEAATAPAWRRIALRALGSWFAAIGLMMGGLAFAV